MVLIDDAVLVAPAAVGQIFPHTPFEETFATFTTDSPIVTAWKDKKYMKWFTKRQGDLSQALSLRQVYQSHWCVVSDAGIMWTTTGLDAERGAQVFHIISLQSLQ